MDDRVLRGIDTNDVEVGIYVGIDAGGCFGGAPDHLKRYSLSATQFTPGL